MPQFLITSAVAYVNGVKHLGNLVGSANLKIRRYIRLRGKDNARFVPSGFQPHCWALASAEDRRC